MYQVRTSLDSKPDRSLSLINKRGRESSLENPNPLFRELGNQSKMQSRPDNMLIQTKLRVGSANDKYEQEADRVADQVMGLSQVKTVHSFQETTQTVQRKCLECEELELLQRKPVTTESRDIGRASLPTVLNKGATCSKCDEEKSIRRKPINMNQSREINRDLSLAGLSNGGQEMSTPERSFFESRFNRNFSNVRIHKSGEAANSALAFNARAYTYGNHIVFGENEYSPSTFRGKHLLAHELTHTIQQQDSPSNIQRKLIVNKNAPSFTNNKDPAFTMTPVQRLTDMDKIIKALCGDFEVNLTSGEVSQNTKATRKQLAAKKKETGCCCLSILASSPITKTIQVSQVVGPHNRGNDIVLSPTNTSIEFGSFTGKGKLAFQGQVPAAGHEICGHAALMVLGAHEDAPTNSRLTTDMHDPTVNIENAISKEQNVPAKKMRGLAKNGIHRGESVDRITIAKFPSNKKNISSLPPAEKNKINFAAAYINENRGWVDILGHSDAAGTSGGKQSASQQRADNVKAELITQGVSTTITKHGLTEPRFTRVEGLSDKQPPDPPLSASPLNWRRAEILIAGFPAGAQKPPSSTPTIKNAHIRKPSVPGLKGSPDPCIKLLVNKAYP